MLAVRRKMRNLVTQVFVGLIAFGTTWAAQPKPKDWLSSHSHIEDFQKGAQQVSETSFFEVRVTRLWTAVDSLSDRQVLPLSEDLARYYAGPLYRSEDGKKPYLVRGLFANYTGSHTLYSRGSSLLITHSSLGHSFEPQFSPLVVNLPSEPKKVFIYV